MHSVMPRWHGLDGVQSPPPTHGMQEPPSHSAGAPSEFAPPSFAPSAQPPSAHEANGPHEASATHPGTTFPSHAASPPQVPSFNALDVAPPQPHARPLTISAARATRPRSALPAMSLPRISYGRAVSKLPHRPHDSRARSVTTGAFRRRHAPLQVERAVVSRVRSLGRSTVPVERAPP